MKQIWVRKFLYAFFLYNLKLFEKSYLIKNFTDMRQDMLTVQVMKIMDSKWKNQNKDYCMTLYEVLPMGRNVCLSFKKVFLFL